MQQPPRGAGKEPTHQNLDFSFWPSFSRLRPPSVWCVLQHPRDPHALRLLVLQSLSELLTLPEPHCGMGTLRTAQVRFASWSSGLRLILSLKCLIISAAGCRCSRGSHCDDTGELGVPGPSGVEVRATPPGRAGGERLPPKRGPWLTALAPTVRCIPSMALPPTAPGDWPSADTCGQLQSQVRTLTARPLEFGPIGEAQKATKGRHRGHSLKGLFKKCFSHLC